MTRPGTIVVVGMLDEREPALGLITREIDGRGHEVVLIDISIGTGAIESVLTPEVRTDEIARLGGGTIEGVKAMLGRERQQAVGLMADGLTTKVRELHAAGRLDGVLAIGGMTSTSISIGALRALPFGVPKVLITSVAAMPAYAGRLSEYFGVRDITVMHSVVDTVGLNPLVRTLALNGASAVCGMVEGAGGAAGEARPSIALTEFGFCDKGAQYVRELLEKEYDVVSFHATGVGEAAAEDLVGQGLFAAFIDLVPAGLSERLLGGNRAAKPDRLEAAGRAGMPYVLAPCGFDMISCGPIERRDKTDPLWTSRRLAERQLFVQDAMRVQARTSPEEMQLIARAVGEKLGRHPSPAQVKFVIPRRGFSSLSVKDGVLHDADADAIFVETLRASLDPAIEVVEVDDEINGRDFARAVVAALGRATAAQPVARR